MSFSVYVLGLEVAFSIHFKPMTMFDPWVFINGYIKRLGGFILVTELGMDRKRRLRLHASREV